MSEKSKPETKRCVNVMGLPGSTNWICLNKFPFTNCDNPYNTSCSSYDDRTGPPKKGVNDNE